MNSDRESLNCITFVLHFQNLSVRAIIIAYNRLDTVNIRNEQK